MTHLPVTKTIFSSPIFDMSDKNGRLYVMSVPAILNPPPTGEVLDVATLQTLPRSDLRELSPQPAQMPRKPREPRQSIKYTREELHFLWYHRLDLGLGWEEVEAQFNRRFRPERNKPGLQCKYYRVLENEGVARTRLQARLRDNLATNLVSQFGIIQKTNYRYSWMREGDRSKPGPQTSRYGIHFMRFRH